MVGESGSTSVSASVTFKIILSKITLTVNRKTEKQVPLQASVS